MKIFLAVSCLLAVAYADYYGGQRYNGPYHIPVIGPNGVPQEPPEVVAARQKHLSAFQGLPQQSQPQQQWNQGPPPQQQWNQGPPPAPVQPRYTGPLARIGPDGMPQYDSAVASARAAHQAAYAEVNSRNGALHAQSPTHWG